MSDPINAEPTSVEPVTVTVAEPTSTSPSTSTNDLAIINDLLVKINDIKINIDSVSNELTQVSQFADNQVKPDYNVLNQMLLDFQRNTLSQLSDRQAKLVSICAELKNSAVLTNDQQNIINSNMNEISVLHGSLVDTFNQMSAKCDSLCGIYSQKLSDVLNHQVELNGYISYLQQLKNFYASIIGTSYPNPNPTPVPAPNPDEKVSRFNNDYFCNVRNHYIGESYVKVEFDVHGNMSLGPLQNPLDSKLVSGSETASVIDHYYEIEDATSTYKGVLVFKFSTADFKDLYFTYGSSGYSQVKIQ